MCKCIESEERRSGGRVKEILRFIFFQTARVKEKFGALTSNGHPQSIPNLSNHCYNDLGQITETFSASISLFAEWDNKNILELLHGMKSEHSTVLRTMT